MLSLSDRAGAEVVVRRRGGGWVCDGPDGVRAVGDGEELVVDGVRWRLSLPDVAAGTRSDGASPDAWALALVADADGERVTARLTHGGEAWDLGLRAHHRLLLALGRERLRALRRDEPEGGWVSPEDLAQHLGQTSNALHVQLHRLRAQLQAIAGASAVLERRFDGEIRLATTRIELQQER